MHKCKYLIHTNGDVITSQVKAWNDTVRMAMMVDLVLKPGTEARGGKLLLWMDNCSCHKVDAVLDPIFREANITVKFLPVNTTYMLQVLDLVVNGPLKAHIRRERAKQLLEYFADFKLRHSELLQLPIANRVSLPWKPPKPTILMCLKNVCSLMHTGSFVTQEFQASVQKSFNSCGLYMFRDNEFVAFTSKALSHGVVPIAPTSCKLFCPIVDGEAIDLLSDSEHEETESNDE